MNWRTFSVITGALFILPLSAYAAESYQNNPISDIQPNNIAQMNRGCGGGRYGRGEKMERLMQQLDLTTEQSRQIAAIKEESRTQTQALREQMDAEKEKMRSLLSSDADSEELKQQHQKIQDIHQQLGDSRFETMLQMREVLTPEQRAQMSELMEQNRGRKFRS